MSTVKICRIKLPKQEPGTGGAFPWLGAVHSGSESLYIPDPSGGDTLIINTENDRITGRVDNTGKNSIASVCAERDLLFLTGPSSKEALVFKIGNRMSHPPMRFHFPPGKISLDGDRDLILVSRKEYSFWSYPDVKAIDFPRSPGEAVETSFDDLEDSFLILLQNPSHLLVIKSGRILSLSRDVGFGKETVNSAVLCSVERKIVAGTESGKILLAELDTQALTTVAEFREPVKKVIFNPLVNHLYIIFKQSRNLAVFDLENKKVREVEKCGSEISDIMFDDLHNKIYALLPSFPALEAYLDMGR